MVKIEGTNGRALVIVVGWCARRGESDEMKGFYLIMQYAVASLQIPPPPPSLSPLLTYASAPVDIIVFELVDEVVSL